MPLLNMWIEACPSSFIVEKTRCASCSISVQLCAPTWCATPVASQSSSLPPDDFLVGRI
jgi:hypothetical protein